MPVSFQGYRRFGKTLLYFYKSNINPAAAAHLRQVERGEKPHESVTVMLPSFAWVDKPDTPRLDALCRNRTAKNPFRPRHVLWRGRVRPGFGAGRFFVPVIPCFHRSGWGRAGKQYPLSLIPACIPKGSSGPQIHPNGPLAPPAGRRKSTHDWEELYT